LHYPDYADRKIRVNDFFAQNFIVLATAAAGFGDAGPTDVLADAAIQGP
jgi:hypothetical protein